MQYMQKHYNKTFFSRFCIIEQNLLQVESKMWLQWLFLLFLCFQNIELKVEVESLKQELQERQEQLDKAM